MNRNSKLVGHAERNAELVRLFRSKRTDLDEARSIELHFWCWGQPNSVRLAHELYKRGFMVLLLKPALLEEDSERWNIEAGTRMSITNVIAKEFTESLVDIAGSFKGEYDGWGTSV